MTQAYVMDLVRHMLWLVCLIAGPVLLGGLIVGLVMGVLQAATQIQESSLTFLPKMIVVILALSLGGSWALDKMVTYASQMLVELANLAPRGLG